MRPILQRALNLVPAGSWAIGVSGGADSVALLALLRQRRDVALHVVHLDHQTRGPDSTADAAFVQQLAGQWHLPCTIARRDELEAAVTQRQNNPSAHYRALRLALFAEVVARHRLQGVILAHHRDDQAETILHRLIRGVGVESLAGMTPRTSIGQLLVLRPLLDVPRAMLRQFLAEQQLAWREDASNQSDDYLRNRLRRLLQSHAHLEQPLLQLGEAAHDLREWMSQHAPRLPEQFSVQALRGIPPLLARAAARQWLRERGAPPQDLSSQVIQRLLEMVEDAASPSRQHFPGQLLVTRRQGTIQVQPSPRDESL